LARVSSQLPTEFRPVPGGFGRQMKPLIVPFVFLFVIMLALGSVPFGGNVAGGVVAAVVLCGALVGIQYAKYIKKQEGTVLHFSEYGIELTDTWGWRVSLGWRDMTHVGPVVTQSANPKAMGAPGGVQVSVGPSRSLGISGWGERVIPRSAPRWQRQLLATAPTNPTDGRPMVAIPLGDIDPSWTTGPMGQWFRRYRPDLLD
jgi:hypothetical protein